MEPENPGIRADLAPQPRLIRAQGRERSTRARTGQDLPGSTAMEIVPTA